MIIVTIAKIANNCKNKNNYGAVILTHTSVMSFQELKLKMKTAKKLSNCFYTISHIAIMNNLYLFLHFTFPASHRA